MILQQQAVPGAPRVDAALDRTVLPVVDRYVLTDPEGPLGGDEFAKKNRDAPRGFCTERVIEIRPAGTALRVGLVAWCAHFVRDGATLTELDGGLTGRDSTMSRYGSGGESSCQQIICPGGSLEL